MDIQKNYNTWSETYDTDRNLTRDLDAIVTRQYLSGSLCSHIPLKFNNAVEVGCGTGKNTQFLSEICGSLSALDFSDGMLDLAKEKVKSDNVKFIKNDITKPWQIPDTAADLLCSNLILEHIENLDFIFSEAARILAPGGIYLLSELHPYRQYQGKKAEIVRGNIITEIHAYTHHITEFIEAAEKNNLSLITFKEHWHTEDQNKPPRLITFLFRK